MSNHLLCLELDNSTLREQIDFNNKSELGNCDSKIWTISKDIEGLPALAE